MGFKMKYPIRADYLPVGTKRRGGAKAGKIRFIVFHDTGNPGSTAKGNVNYYKNSANSMSASAHIFVDDKEIIECIPAITGTPEKAWHVIYDVTTDNKMYGDDANDVAIGVEMCWGGNINHTESYKRTIWTIAYLCYKFGLDPKRDVVGHDVLDPKRKIDPTNGLKHMGKTYSKALADIVKEYQECTGEKSTPIQKPSPKVGKTHKVVKGDTLWGISRKYGITVAKLKSLNPEVDPHALKIGAVLVIDPTVKEETSKPASNADPRLAEYLKHAPVRPYPGKQLQRGSRGKDVEAVQRALKISVDGIYGAKTEQAVKNYQRKFPFLKVDGIVAYETWNVMF